MKDRIWMSISASVSNIKAFESGEWYLNPYVRQERNFEFVHFLPKNQNGNNLLSLTTVGRCSFKSFTVDPTGNKQI